MLYYIWVQMQWLMFENYQSIPNKPGIYSDYHLAIRLVPSAAVSKRIKDHRNDLKRNESGRAGFKEYSTSMESPTLKLDFLKVHTRIGSNLTLRISTIG